MRRGRTFTCVFLVYLIITLVVAQPVMAASVVPLPNVNFGSGTEQQSYPVKLRAWINPFAEPGNPDWKGAINPEAVWSSESGTRPVWTNKDDVWVFIDAVGLSKNIDSFGLTLDQFQTGYPAIKTPFGYAVHFEPGSLQPVLYNVQAYARHHNDLKVYRFLITVKLPTDGQAVGSLDLQVRSAPDDWTQLSRNLRQAVRSFWSSIQAGDMETGLPVPLQQALMKERGQPIPAPPTTTTTQTTTTTTPTATPSPQATPSSPPPPKDDPDTKESTAKPTIMASVRGVEVRPGATLTVKLSERASVPLVIHYGEGVDMVVLSYYRKGETKPFYRAAKKRAEVKDGRREVFFYKYTPGRYLIQADVFSGGKKIKPPDAWWVEIMTD